MKATKEYVERKFEEFNRQMFAGRLPKLPIELSDAKTFLGLCVYKKRKDKNGNEVKYDFRLRINTRIDLSEQELENIIIHEMIHYYIGVNQLRDNSAHGRIFKYIMNYINENYHRNVSISFKGSKIQNEQAIDKKARWHVVAKVIFTDGRTGVKVLPRVLTSILRFYNTVRCHSGVKNIELYMSNNVFFNKYPNSAALKIYFIERQELDDNLAGAEPMDYDRMKRL